MLAWCSDVTHFLLALCPGVTYFIWYCVLTLMMHISLALCPDGTIPYVGLVF